MRGLGLICRIQHLITKHGGDSRGRIVQSRWLSSRLRVFPVLTRQASPAAAGYQCHRQFQNQLLRCFQTSIAHRDDKDAIVSVPPFPESITEGDLRWNKNVGDTVLVDEVVCEIETDKTSMPVPSPEAGVIVKRFVEDGATVKQDQPLFSIKIGKVAPKKSKSPKPAAAAPPAPRTPSPSTSRPPTPRPPSPPPKPSTQPKFDKPTPPPKIDKPSAKIDKPTPPPKAKKPIPALPATPLPPVSALQVKIPPSDPTKEIYGTRTEHRVKLSRIRKRIASRLKEAQNVNAMLTTFNEIDMSSIIEFRKTHQEAFNKKYGVKLGFMSAFLKASAYALQDQPVVNAVITEDEIVYRDYIDISVAVASPKGLVVPVLRSLETMNFGDIELAIADLAVKARDGKLAVEDMDGGTFTVSNGGVYGSLMGTPIINPPQSAILGMHATVERPVVRNGQIVIRPMMYVALTYDHRLIDGREAVLFLRKIKAAVEDPRIMVAGL